MKIKKVVVVVFLFLVSFFLISCDEEYTNYELEDLQIKLSESESKREELEGEINNLRLDIAELNLHLEVKKKEKEALDKSLIDIETTNDNLIKQVESLNNQILSKETELEILTSEKEELEAKIITYINDKEEIDSLKLQLDNLNLQIDTLISDNESLTLEKNLLLDNISTLQLELSLVESQISILNNDINSKDTLINSLTNNKNSLENQISLLLNSQRTYENQIRDLESKNSVLNAERENMFDMFNDVSYIAMKANVMVHAEHTNVFGSGALGQGSGVIFYEDSNYYYVLTNNHVIYDDPQYTYLKYYIIDYKGNKTAAQLHSADANYDLAIMYFRKGTEDLDSLPFSNIDPKVDDTVISIGQPIGQINTISFGKVLRYKQITLSDGGKDISNVQFDVIEHDSPINNGSSGGVLINTKLEIIGINFAGSNMDDKPSDYSYAVPLSKVIEYINLYNFKMQ